MSNRTIRVNELVQRELSAILRQRYQTESAPLTITEVRVSPDLRDARVFVSVLGDEHEAAEKMRWLRSKATEIRQEIEAERFLGGEDPAPDAEPAPSHVH